jgi:hypothetical protein
MPIRTLEMDIGITNPLLKMTAHYKTLQKGLGCHLWDVLNSGKRI